jgi:NTE family protein
MEAKDAAMPTAPVERIPTDPPGDQPQPGIGLCLSGGGFRAMLFHLGALWRLNEASVLPTLARISSVSGGSIASAVLGLAWPRLAFDEGGVARRFGEEVVAPLRRFADRTFDWRAIVGGLLLPGTAAERMARAYRDHLYGRRTLQDLPADGAGPRFVLNASNLQSGVLWRFSRPYAADYRVGRIDGPSFPVAVAVAASAGFPPLLSPAILKLTAADYAPGSGGDLQRPPFTTRVVLADGGVCDNLGLETVWKKLATVLVSDGGGQLAEQERPARDWIFQTRR